MATKTKRKMSAAEAIHENGKLLTARLMEPSFKAKCDNQLREIAKECGFDPAEFGL